MALATTIQCPSCNGANPPNDAGSYLCTFCMTPFTVQQSLDDESRILEELRQWMAQTVGAPVAGGGGVDAATRAYIFGDKMLPALRRQVDRSLETLGSFGQHALLVPPLDVPEAKGRMANPLTSRRSEILGMRSLRARLNNPQVLDFAVQDSHKAEINDLDRRIADFIHLSNVAVAAARRDREGYVSARHNIEALVDEVDQQLRAEGEAGADPKRVAFLGAIKQRYQCLGDLSRCYEELSGSIAPDGAALAERVQRLSQRLRNIARSIEALDHNPAESMPMVVGVDAEANHADFVCRWLSAYHHLGGRIQQPFVQFTKEVQDLVSATSATQLAEHLDHVTAVVRAHRGEVAVPIHVDFSWADAIIETNRKKKTWGLFGVEEETAETSQWLAPVWIGDATLSTSSGTVFKEGSESAAVVMVDACMPDATKVTLITRASHPAQSLEPTAGGFGSHQFGLPRSTAEQAAKIFKLALDRRTDVRNASVKVRGIAWVPATYVRYESKEGDREFAWGMTGDLKLAPSTRVDVEAARLLTQRYT